MGRVIHFEMHAEQPERAVRFYTDVFGWAFQKWDGPMPYWLIKTGPQDRGINGGLVLRQGSAPAEGAAVNAYVCTIEVEALDATAREVEAAGGKTVVPRFPIAGVGWLTYFKDTEGNLFGALQNDPDAA